MAEQQHARHTSPSTMPSFAWSSRKLTATGPWSGENVFCQVTIEAALSGSLMDGSGFGRCQEDVTCLTVKCDGGGIMEHSGFFSVVGLASLVPLKRNLNVH